MYEAYWQLTCKPFESSSDARFYYPSEIHQGALLKLRYAIENRRGGALLAGDSGLGKTLLIQTLRRYLPEQYGPFVHVVFPQMSPGELVRYLADELGATSSSSSSGHIEQNIRAVQHFLARNTAAGRHAVVVADEAQLLVENGALETLRLFTNFETAAQASLTLVLSGHSSLLPALDRMPTLEQRLSVKSLLRPFTMDETAAYVSHRMKAVGAQRDIFTSEALTRLHQLTRGNPRRINRLCDLALLIGYAEEQTTISSLQLETVADELVHVSPDT